MKRLLIALTLALLIIGCEREEPMLVQEKAMNVIELPEELTLNNKTLSVSFTIPKVEHTIRMYYMDKLIDIHKIPQDNEVLYVSYVPEGEGIAGPYTVELIMGKDTTVATYCYK